MKRNAGAQAGEGKIESRFAALTSGLLARKGCASPSNSPIIDPAEETDAFSLEPKSKGGKAKLAAPTAAPAPAALKPQKDAPDTNERAKPSAGRADAPRAPAKGAAAAKPAAPMAVINERSEEAGYPDNPSPEEIAALDAEADEVVSYFQNFGDERAAALEKNSFYDDADPLEDLDGPEREQAPPGGVAVAGPWAGASVPAVASGAAAPVRAGVSVELTAREFMRLSLGAAELGQNAQELIVEAIEEYLDARGVNSLGGCSCLEALAKKPGGG